MSVGESLDMGLAAVAAVVTGLALFFIGVAWAVEKAVVAWTRRSPTGSA